VPLVRHGSASGVTARVSVEIDLAGGIVVENEGVWTVVAQHVAAQAVVTVHRGSMLLGEWLAKRHSRGWLCDDLWRADMPENGKRVARRALRKLS
jgi:hypothetical protein